VGKKNLSWVNILSVKFMDHWQTLYIYSALLLLLLFLLILIFIFICVPYTRMSYIQNKETDIDVP
jgi:uncharacterized integral membrane protein